MKIAKVVLDPCPLFKNLEPIYYLGFRFYDPYIEHIIKTKNDYKKIKTKCESCVLAYLIKNSYLITTPIYDGKNIKIYCIWNKNLKNLNFKNIKQIEILNYKKIFLTPRQRKVLRMAVSNRLSKVADNLGVSKTAVFKSFKSALRKVSEIL